MTFTTFAQLQAAVANSSKTWEERIAKSSLTTKAVGIWGDTWTSTGNPTAGVTPNSAAGAVTTNTTVGALNYSIVRNPDAADNRYLLSFGVAGQGSSNPAVGVNLLVDRLVHSSNLSGTVATAQTVGTPALTRYTTGDGVMMALVCWTATGTTAANVTVTYTNQAGTASRTSPSIALWTGGWGGSTLGPVAGQLQFIPLQAGDSGVRSVQSVTLSASTLTAGSFGVILFKPLVTLFQPGYSSYFETDYAIQTSSLPEIQDSACLSAFVFATSSIAAPLTGIIKTVEG